MPKEQLVVSLRNPSPAPVSSGTPPPQQPRKRSGTRTLFISIVLLAIVGIAGWSFISAESSTPDTQSGDAPSVGTNAAAAAAGAQSAKSSDIIAQVGTHIELPQGETPTIATVTDPSKLIDQPFFAKARAGDIVLIYTAAREAYLFDPTQNKLVTVAPITTNAAAATSSGMSAARQ